MNGLMLSLFLITKPIIEHKRSNKAEQAYGLWYIEEGEL
jgi:hypothetical protein